MRPSGWAFPNCNSTNMGLTLGLFEQAAQHYRCNSRHHVKIVYNGFESYLSKRSTVSVSPGATSKIVSVERRVPQVSALGPLLFFYFIQRLQC